MPQFAQRLGLYLADAFASNGKVLADLFERVLRAGVPKPETHLYDLFLTRRQRCEHLVGDLAQIRKSHRLSRIEYRFVLDKIAEMRIFLFTDGRFERDRLLRDLENLSYLG